MDPFDETDDICEYIKIIRNIIIYIMYLIIKIYLYVYMIWIQ